MKLGGYREDKPYRGAWRQADGTVVVLDFYAANFAMAKEHADLLARVGPDLDGRAPMTRIKVRALKRGEPYDERPMHAATIDDVIG